PTHHLHAPPTIGFLNGDTHPDDGVCARHYSNALARCKETLTRQGEVAPARHCRWATVAGTER
ncbi:MAG: hypothetical protein RRB24_11485, partial [Armatimonadota bacterium]|nr:hypothetical protein [Armatimonadota bacterium]MDT7973439.1 hypothetical protein [Armatimonadota bacterium]